MPGEKRAFVGLVLITSAASSNGWLEDSLPATTCSRNATTSFTYSSFTFDQLTSDVYATPLSSPVSYATPFAPAFSAASTLLPANATYTTFSLDAAATSVNDGQYGQSAYNALWSGYTYNETVPFTTTRSATPVASSELVYPPALYTACPASGDACLDCFKLPADFVWGVAGSAPQIEGGSQSEGRGPSTVDFIGNLGAGPGTPDYLGSSASALLSDFVIADMNYYLYKQDLARLAALGVPYYSFSISWSRILPFGVVGSPVNQQAIDHYDDVIKTCLGYGIKPIVTLVHFDFPIYLFPTTERELFRSSFLNYAAQVMARWAADVPYWVTFNEPNSAVPSWTSDYNVYTNILLAHADVYRWYHDTLNGTGLVSIKFSNGLAIPLTASADDRAAALRYQAYDLGIMGNPLFLGQQYPASVLDSVNLTALSAAELAHVNGSVDYLAIDAYVAQFAAAPPGGVAACAANASNAYFPKCAVTSSTQANGWLLGAASNAYAYIAPQYVRQQLGYLWNTFRPRAIIVAEFGFNPIAEAASTTSLAAVRYDIDRTLYYHGFVRELAKAVALDGVNVVGALAWSFVDNNEFGSYANRYGMQAVNRTSGDYERVYKRSFFDFVQFFQHFVDDQ